MKKIIKLVIAIIVALLIISGVMILVDCSAIKSEKAPIFARMSDALNDGGTVIYTGFGYKIIDFHMLNGYDETKVGTLFTKPEDFKSEYEKFDKNLRPIEDEKQNEEEKNINSGDIVKESGENTNISGDNVKESGEKNIISGDNSIKSGDNNEIVEKISSGDLKNSGDATKEEKLSFIGYIVGLKGDTAIVKPLEEQEINKSSDMISFSTKSIVTQNFMIGQKIKVTYSGDIKETYPAHVDAVNVEIVE